MDKRVILPQEIVDNMSKEKKWERIGENIGQVIIFIVWTYVGFLIFNLIFELIIK